MTVIVIDASAALAALLNAGLARDALGRDRVCAPDLIDAEVAEGLRRGAAAGRVPADVAWAALDTWRQLGVRRFPTGPLLKRAWELREVLDTPTAASVALAERLGCDLLTARPAVAATKGPACPIKAVPT